jgi:predicted AlkP superfamily pyrophosphatase or phosphodiesterase
MTFRHPTLFARAVVVTAALLWLPSSAPGGPTAADGPVGAIESPRLVVILSVDQLRGDYLDRYGSQWKHGLRRLLDNGAWFVNAAYPYARTVTCVGHATIGTGTYPWKHGLVNNAWWDRATRAETTCTADRTTPAVSYGTKPTKAADSARFLMIPTFADELRAQSGHPVKVVSLSMKARAAIMMAGHRGDLVAWFDGEWVSSSAHGSTERHPFVARFLDEHPMARELDAVWERAAPTSTYLFTDDGEAESFPQGWTAQFPHPIRASGTGKSTETTPAAAITRWETSPFSDAYLGRMASAALETLNLGKGPGTDVLAVSFSALDRIGHEFGPRSHEVQDTLVRLDATIGDLLTALDRAVGRDRYVVAFSADHGVAPIPEQMRSFGLDAGRVTMADVAKRAEAAFSQAFGAGTWIDHRLSGDLYFSEAAHQRLREKPEVWGAVLAAAEQSPGVLRAYRTDQLLRGEYANDPLAHAVRLSLYPGRSPDVYITVKPNWLMAAEGATHGSPHAYDRSVPVILMGRPFGAERHFGEASPADIAPTLAALTGVRLPSPDGRVLVEAFVQAPAKAPETARRP